MTASNQCPTMMTHSLARKPQYNDALYVCVCMYACMHVCMCVCACVCVCVCVCVVHPFTTVGEFVCTHGNRVFVLHERAATATAATNYTTIAPLLLLTAPHPPTSQPTLALAEPPNTRTRRARLQRDGIGANGTLSPLPVTVNPCAQSTPPSIDVEGSAEATPPP